MLSELFENINYEKSEMSMKIDSMNEKMNKMQTAMYDLIAKQENNTETILDLRRRSMEDNLIFYGIEEKNLQKGEFEDTDATLNTFLEKEMNIQTDIKYHKVHRIGRRRIDTS